MKRDRNITCMFSVKWEIVHWNKSTNERGNTNDNWIPSLGRHIDGLVQERRNSSALAMELRLSCTNQSMYSCFIPEVLSSGIIL